MSEMPHGWQDMKIGNLCQLVNGRAFKPTDWTKEGLPIIRIQNLNNIEAPFNRYSGQVEDKYLIDNGDLLFAWSGTPGTSFGAHTWNGGCAVLNQHIFKVLFDSNKIDRDFFKFAINYKLDELIGKAHGGVGLRHITKGKFEETILAVPPLDEQRCIVAKLNSLITKSRRAREELERIPRLVERYKQAILTTAFSGELTADWRDAQGVSTIWEESTIGSALLDLRYGTSKKCDYTPTETPVLRIPNITESGIDQSDLKYATFTKAEREALALKSGDILIIRSNGSVDLVGRAAVVTEREVGYLFAGYLIRLRFSDDIDPHFILYSLQEPSTRNQIETLAKSTSGVNNINTMEVKSLPIKKPSIEEQREIVARLNVAFNHINQVAFEAERAAELLDRLDQATIAKAFRGELVPQALSLIK